MTSNTRFFTTLGCELAFLAFVGWIDYVFVYEVGVYSLYLIPMGWITWRINLGWGLVFSMLNTATWEAVDVLLGHHLSRTWMVWNRAGNGLVIFVAVACCIHICKKKSALEKHRVKQLEGSLPICQGCKRIQDASGYWSSLDQYPRENTNAQPQLKLCPDCARAKYIGGSMEGLDA